MSLPMHDGEITAPSTGDKVKDANMTMGGALMAAMMAKALKGDTKAANLIMQVTGQLEERITVRQDPYDGLSTDELRRLSRDDDPRERPQTRTHRPGPA